MDRFLSFPTAQQINYPLSRKSTQTHTHTINKEDFPGLGSTLNEKLSHNNNPQQYCVSHSVKLMSMFPFIECCITLSGCRESSISDCHRSI